MELPQAPLMSHHLQGLELIALLELVHLLPFSIQVLVPQQQDLPQLQVLVEACLLLLPQAMELHLLLAALLLMVLLQPMVLPQDLLLEVMGHLLPLTEPLLLPDMVLPPLRLMVHHQCMVEVATLLLLVVAVMALLQALPPLEASHHRAINLHHRVRSQFLSSAQQAVLQHPSLTQQVSPLLRPFQVLPPVLMVLHPQ